MSPRTRKQNEEIRRKSKSKILDTALELFAKQGFHNTTIDQVAEKASMAKGSIYTYFSSKMKLLEGIIDRLIVEEDEILEQMESHQTSREQLAFLIETTFQFMLKNPNPSRLLTALALQLEQFPSIEQVIKSRYVSLIPFMIELMKKNGFSDKLAKTEARLLSATLEGIGMQYLILNDALPIHEIKQEILIKYCSEP